MITRALGPEGTVEVDTRSFRARAGDVYLLCSDGLTTMLPEGQITELLQGQARLRDAGEALIAAANAAGGRDNITVVLLRLEDVRPGGDPLVAEQATMTGIPAVTAPVSRRRPRLPPSGENAGEASATARSRRHRRIAGGLAAALTVLGLLVAAAYLAMQQVYFVGTNSRGLVTLFQGLPYQLPGSVTLYSSHYVSGVSASTLSSGRRRTLLDHSLRSESDAASLIRSLELGQLE